MPGVISRMTAKKQNTLQEIDVRRLEKDRQIGICKGVGF